MTDIMTARELAIQEIMDEAREGYFGAKSLEILRQMHRPYEQMSNIAKRAVDARANVIQSYDKD